MNNLNARLVLALLLAIGLVGSMTVPESAETGTRQTTLTQLEAKFQKQYVAIEYLFANSPATKGFSARANKV